MTTKRGTTLLELTVSMTVSLVILAAATLLTRMVLRKVFWVEEASDRQLRALQAIQLLQRDWARSAAEGIKIQDDTVTVAAQSDQKAQTQRLWADSPVVWGNHAEELIRAEAPLGAAPSGEPPSPTLEQVRGYLSTTPGWNRRHFAGVVLTSVAVVDGRYVVRLTTRTRTLSGELRPQELSATLWLGI